MKRKIDTKLIDTPNECEIDYWTGEWINEEDIIKNLVDESVVLTIANQTVRNRMLSISREAEFIKDKNKELNEELHKLENKNRELQNQINDMDKIIHQKALEMLKDVEREKYGYAVGDKLYMIIKKTHGEKELCPVCNGKRKYTINGIKIDCSYCNYDGYHHYTVYDPLEYREIIVEYNSVKITVDTDNETANGSIGYSYTKDNMKHYGVIKSYDRVFKTKEEAEEYIKNNETY